MSNSTLSGNSAEEYGGGVENVGFYNGSATVTLNNSTFSGNSGAFGGGIDNYASTGNGGQGTIEIANTILNAGASGENINNESATVVSHGYNLSSDAVGGDKTAVPGGLLNGPGDIRNTNPMLGPLQNNGGPTMTHALLITARRLIAAIRTSIRTCSIHRCFTINAALGFRASSGGEWISARTKRSTVSHPRLTSFPGLGCLTSPRTRD